MDSSLFELVFDAVKEDDAEFVVGLEKFVVDVGDSGDKLSEEGNFEGLLGGGEEVFGGDVGEGLADWEAFGLELLECLDVLGLHWRVML